MHTHEHYGTSSAAATLYIELNKLTDQYPSYLKQESLTREVEELLATIEAYQNGSTEAAAFLKEHGEEQLKKLKEGLQAAEAEAQRIDEESPNSKHFSGARADDISCAVALAADAEAKMHAVVEEEINK